MLRPYATNVAPGTRRNRALLQIRLEQRRQPLARDAWLGGLAARLLRTGDPMRTRTWTASASLGNNLAWRRRPPSIEGYGDGSVARTPYNRHMAHDPGARRRSIRLPAYDYALPGAYYVTVVTKDRQAMFGEVVDGVVRMNGYGQAVDACWSEIAVHFPRVTPDAFVVMPNHIHGIVVINDVGAQHAGPLRNNVVPGSLGAIVRSFKSASTKRINLLRNAPGALVWQRNYYEHVIRADDDLDRIRQYILDNPLRWEMDEYNPNR